MLVPTSSTTTSFNFTMPASLDPLYFPHIFEAILANTERETLLAARLVCSSMLNVVNPLLCGSYLRIMRDSGGILTALTNTSRGEYWSAFNLRVPYFYRNGNEATQAAAVRRLRFLHLNTRAPGSHLNRLLQHLPPTAEIEMHHDGALESDIVIPHSGPVYISASTKCGCHSDGGTFAHAASEVQLTVYNDGKGPRCRMVAGVINPNLSELDICGELPGLPDLFEGIDVRASPDLQVLISDPDGCYFAEQDDLCRQAVERFNISEDQVEFEGCYSD